MTFTITTLPIQMLNTFFFVVTLVACMTSLPQQVQLPKCCIKITQITVIFILKLLKMFKINILKDSKDFQTKILVSTYKLMLPFKSDHQRSVSSDVETLTRQCTSPLDLH